MNSSSNKIVLILGATGFVGRAILQSLLQIGKYRIVALQHHTSISVSHNNLQIINGSISGINLKEIQPDIIIHAARNRTGKFGSFGRWIMSQKGHLENAHLLSQIKKMEHKPIVVYCSGSLMYGSHTDTIIDESFPLQPVSFAKQYYKAEIPFLHSLERNEIPIIMLRLPWVIGSGSWFKWNYIQKISKEGFIPVYGEGYNKMSFIDVDAIGKIINYLAEVDFKGILNLFHPESLTQNEFAKLLSELMGEKSEKLSNKEWQQLPFAVKEAFATEIVLGSKHIEIQKQLLPFHEPLKVVIKNHLSSLQNK